MILISKIEGESSLQAIASWLVLCTIVALSSTFTTAQIAAAPQTTAPAEVQTHPQELKVTEYRLPPDKLAKAAALYKTSTVLYLAGLVFGIVILWVLLKLRVGPALRNLAECVSRNRFLQTLIFVPLLTLLIAVISLPFDIYGHHISRFWLLTLPFAVLLIFVAPVILDPMFNSFEPLEKTQPQLVSEIEKVTQRGGLNIPRDHMFEMNASAKVTTYNAYVTGIGATKRVVVWDNTARDLTVPETLFVFGHEMGHYVLNHIYKGLAFFAVTSLFGFWLGRRIVLMMLTVWGGQWHIRGLNDLAALPVLMLALSLLTFAGEPIGNAFSRHIEHQADIYGLEVTHGLFPNNGEVAASSFQKLGEKSYDYPTPNPLLVFWSYGHPTIAQRIRFSLRYNPWNAPDRPKYVK